MQLEIPSTPEGSSSTHPLENAGRNASGIGSSRLLGIGGISEPPSPSSLEGGRSENVLRTSVLIAMPVENASLGGEYSLGSIDYLATTLPELDSPEREVAQPESATS